MSQWTALSTVSATSCSEGHSVYLRDIWPSEKEVAETVE